LDRAAGALLKAKGKRQKEKDFAPPGQVSSSTARKDVAAFGIN
jgi:hypothetical protein